jgi:transcriptional regulator with XRE-family HTH domain
VSELSQHFALVLQRQRLRADFSAEELAFLSGMHKTAITHLERGERLPRLDSIVRLAGGLEIEPSELLAGIRYRPGGFKPGRYEVTDEPDVEVRDQ